MCVCVCVCVMHRGEVEGIKEIKEDIGMSRREGGIKLVALPLKIINIVYLEREINVINSFE